MVYSFIFTCRYGYLQCEYSQSRLCVCVCSYLYIHKFFLASNVASMGPCTGSVSGSVTGYLGIRRSIYSFTILWGAAYSISSLVDTWVRAAESSRTASYCFAGIFTIWRFILQGLQVLLKSWTAIGQRWKQNCLWLRCYCVLKIFQCILNV